MKLSDTFEIVESYDFGINWILEEANYVLKEYNMRRVYKNPITKLVRVDEINNKKIYHFEIWEEK